MTTSLATAFGAEHRQEVLAGAKEGLRLTSHLVLGRCATDVLPRACVHAKVGAYGEDLMTIDSFATLLDAARARPEPQLMLLTFAALEAEPGRPGRQALTPVACVDKRAPDVADFATLAREAAEALGGAHWDVLLVSTLSGTALQWPDTRQAEAALRAMIAAIRLGKMEKMVAFDRDGMPLRWAA